MYPLIADDNPTPLSCKDEGRPDCSKCNWINNIPIPIDTCICWLGLMGKFAFGHYKKNPLDLEFFYKMYGFAWTCAYEWYEFAQGLKLTQLMIHVKLATSVSDAMRKIKSGAVKVNKIQIKDVKYTISKPMFDHWFLIQHGKQNIGIVFIESCEEWEIDLREF